jgi:hypothetical protein
VYIGTRSGFVGKSVDGGVTWAQASSGITGSSVYLVALTLDPSTPTTLYASIGGTGPVKLYKSTNSAGTWTQLSGAPDYTGLPYYYGSGSGDQGWYDHVIAVDPTNSNHLVAGGIALAQSTDGGVTWSKINIIHPDQHALAFTAAGDLWIGCDGGVFHYTPPSTFTDNNGDLNITQFYGGFNVVGTSILAGSQDNGTVLGSTNSQAAWPFVLGGDGGASAITPNHPSLQFAEATGHLYRTTDAWATTTTYISPFAAEEDDGGEDPVDADGSGEFIPPMIVVPNSATPDSPTVLMGGSDLYRTTNPSAASPTWTQVTSVGTNVTAIAASPTDPQVVYVGFHNGTVEVSTNNGVSFTPLASESRSENYVTGISVDPTNSHAITVSFSYNATRYDAGFAHVEQYSFSTTPASGTWTTISGSGLPSAVSRVVYDDGNLLAATDSGVYATGVVNGASTVWSRVGSGLPFVQVQDAFVADDGTVYIVTHGRGAWKLPPPAAPVTHVSSDFDGDGRSDVAVYRPGSAGHWYVEESGGGSVNTGFGTTGDIPVPGDYDGDGETDIAVFRPSTGKWYVKTSSGTSQTVGWGTSTDIPVPGDYDGDGETDLAVFRPSTGKWLIKNSSGGTQTIGWGTSTDIPIPGDYDGDNVTDAAVFRPTAGKWLIKGSDGTNTTVGWGISTDIPVPADYDGDGKADLAVFRPSSGKWYVIYSGSSPTTATVGFGTSGDIPVPADFNGDGSADIAVFRPSNHRWYVYGGNTTSFGTSGDIPLEVPPAVYLHSFGWLFRPRRWAAPDW